MKTIIEDSKRAFSEQKSILNNIKSNYKLIGRKQDPKVPHHLPPKLTIQRPVQQSRYERSRSNNMVRISKESYKTEEVQPEQSKIYSFEASELEKAMSILTECLDSSAQNQKLESRSKVFNKFTRQQKQQIRQTLQLLENPVFKTRLGDNIVLLIKKVRVYIDELESNNCKLLEINYFFQKQFNNLVTERQVWKRQKCNKNYCLECRYHLQKQNDWKQQKSQLEANIDKLKQEVSSMKTLSIPSIERASVSIMVEEPKLFQKPSLAQDLREELLTLEQLLQKKDEDYLILLKQFNYLTNLNKQNKARVSSLMEEYKYLSIENRTLLKARHKLLETQVQCAKLKGQRDQFRKKAIEYHRKLMEKEEEEDQGKGESMFSLSSVSQLH